MRKEIIGLILFFLVIFTLISLISFSPTDPSILQAAVTDKPHNLFGLMGAHLSGLLIGLFGLGAFWVPAICLLTSIHFLGNHSTKAITLTLGGGVLLAVTTGALMALKQHQYLLFGAKFSAGGIIGIPLKNFLVTSANATGALTILVVLWVVGFILGHGLLFPGIFRPMYEFRGKHRRTAQDRMD